MPRNFVNATLKESHYYLDGTSGNDTNDGLTVGTAKKTFEGVMAIIPDVIKHHTVVHLSGTINLEASGSTIYLSKTIAVNGLYFIFDGGDDTVEAAPGSTGLTMTSSGVAFITKTGAGWTVDQWKGVWIKTADNQYRMIQGNTADTLIPTIDFSPAPSGDFDIVVPGTQITSTSARTLTFSCIGLGYPTVQRMRLSGGVRLYFRKDSLNSATGIVSSNTSAYAFYAQAGDVSLIQYLWDPISPPALLINHQTGCSFNNGTVNFADDTKRVTIHSLIAKTCNLYGSSVSAITNGCRFGHLNLDACTVAVASYLGSQGNRVNIIDGSTSVGVKINGVVGQPNFAASRWEINNCASHGIEIIKSNVKFLGTVAGSGNGGAGVYAHDNSIVTIKDGSPPTLTGTVGDCSTDGTTERTTWAEVDADSPITDLYESTTIKEVA